MAQWLPWIVVLLAAAVAAVTDLRLRRIPNWVTFPLLAGGLVWQATTGGWLGPIVGLCGGLIAALPFAVLFVFALGGGAGDVKLMGAAGVWLGIGNSLLAVVMVALLGGLLALGFALWSGRLFEAVRNLSVMIWVGMSTVSGYGRLSESRQWLPPTAAMQPMPYGLAIFLGIGAAAALTWGHWVNWGGL
jgi:prepilin peptidase CpaA